MNDAPKKGEMDTDRELEIEKDLEVEREMETDMEMEMEKAGEKGDEFEHMVGEKEKIEEKGEMETDMEMEMEKAGEKGEIAASVNTAETEPAVVIEEAAETVNAAKTKEPVVTNAAVTEPAAVTQEAAVSEPQPAAVTEAVVIRQPVETVNAAELASQLLVHHFEKDIDDIVSEGLEEMVLKKANRLLKKIEQTKSAAEAPKPELKRTKMMSKKRKSSLEEIEEKRAKRIKRKEEKQQKKEEQKRYFKQRMLVLNPNPQQPIEATPLEAQPPEIVHWDTFVDEDSDNDYIRIKRADGQFDVQRSWISVLRRYTRADLEEMHKVGKELYGNLLGEDVEFSYCKMVLEHLCCMFEPETIDYLIRRPFERVINWTLHENCAVYSILLDTGLFEFYLVDRIYRHSFKRLNGMIAVKLKCKAGSAMGDYLVKRTLNQQLGLDPDLGLN